MNKVDLQRQKVFSFAVVAAVVLLDPNAIIVAHDECKDKEDKIRKVEEMNITCDKPSAMLQVHWTSCDLGGNSSFFSQRVCPTSSLLIITHMMIEIDQT